MIEALDPQFGGKDVVNQVVDGVMEAKRPHMPYLHVFAHDIVMQAVAGARRMEYPTDYHYSVLCSPLQPYEITEVQQMLDTTHDALSNLAAGRQILPTSKKLPGKMVMAPSGMEVAHEPPRHYVSSDILAETYDSYPRHIEMRLAEELPNASVAVRLGARCYELWHDPSVQEQLDANPPLKAAKVESYLTLRELAYLLAIDPKRSKELPKRFPITAVALCNEWGIEVAGITHDDAEIALHQAAQMPFAHATDVLLKGLAEETDLGFVQRALRAANYTPRKKRVHPNNRVRPGMQADHVGEEQAHKVKALFKEQEDLSYMTLTEIAEAAHTSLARIIRGLTEDEQEQFIPQHLIHGLGRANGIAKCLPRDVAQAVIERLGTQPVPGHLVPLHVLHKRSRYSRADTVDLIDELEPEVHTIKNVRGATSPEISCVSWAFMQAFEQRYPPAPDEIPITFEDLPDSEDAAPQAALYAQILHGVYSEPLADEYVDAKQAAAVLALNVSSLKANLKAMGYSQNKAGDVQLAGVSRLLPRLSWM